MKKILVTALFFASAAGAAPVGNPSFPKLLQDGYFIPSCYSIALRVGYEGDFIGDGRMKQCEEGSGRVDDYRQDTNSGTITLSFFDRLDLYGVLGSARVCTDWRFIAPGPMTNRIVLETNYNFLWAAGGRGILVEWGKTTLGIGGRYSATELKPISTSINGLIIPSAGTRLHWHEWQVDLDLSHQIEIFIPYVGVKYSSARTEIGTFSSDFPISSNDSGTMHMSNRSPVGLVIGCTLTTGKFFMLNIEGRLIDEEAATIVGDFRF